MQNKTFYFLFAGGVLGFWGGVWCLGIIFILVLVAKRVACRRGEERQKVIKSSDIIIFLEVYLYYILCRCYDPALVYLSV